MAYLLDTSILGRLGNTLNPQQALTLRAIAEPHAVCVSGRQVHGTRLVAVCHVHGITHLLAFNTREFLCSQNLGPGLTVVDPGDGRQPPDVIDGPPPSAGIISPF